MLNARIQLATFALRVKTGWIMRDVQENTWARQLMLHYHQTSSLSRVKFGADVKTRCETLGRPKRLWTRQHMLHCNVPMDPAIRRRLVGVPTQDLVIRRRCAHTRSCFRVLRAKSGSRQWCARMQSPRPSDGATSVVPPDYRVTLLSVRDDSAKWPAVNGARRSV